MNNKTQRISAAKETLSAFEDGFYNVNDKKIDIRQLHKISMESTYLYDDVMTNNINIKNNTNLFETSYYICDLPVVSCLQKLKNQGKDNIGILNFASAKNAGGGFLNGAQAQEESLAMCSNLYLTQLKNEEYYNANRKCNTMLYTDYMIYSKDVVFIREDAGLLWEKPYVASVLTAPAINMGQYLLKGNVDITYAEKIMKDRMRKILKVFAKQKNEILILGAYGCGVFRNDPKVIAKFFLELLVDEALSKHFKEIVFAVYDTSKSRNIYNSFKTEIDKISKLEF